MTSNRCTMTTIGLSCSSPWTGRASRRPRRGQSAPGHAQVQVRRTNPLPSPLFLPWHISCSEITSMLQCLLDITLQVIEGKNFLSTLMRLYHLEQPCRSVHESLICSLNKMLSNCRNKQLNLLFVDFDFCVSVPVGSDCRLK